MKRLLCILIATVAFVSLSFAPAQEPAVPKKTEPNPKTVDWKSGPGPVQPSTEAAGRRTLSLRESRRLGITISSVRTHIKALKADGSIDANTSTAEISALVLDRISASDAKAFEAVDLDSLLAFIEKLVELIMKLFVVDLPNVNVRISIDDVHWSHDVLTLAA